MDRKNGLPLVLIKSAPEHDTMNTPIAAASCTHCGGASVERRQGTAYCCDINELARLRDIISDLDRQLAIELEDAPHDQHIGRFLTYVRTRVCRARRLKS